MIQIEEKEIVKGIDEAYKKAGSNAYFGNGFKAGVDFALERVKNLTIPVVTNWVAVKDKLPESGQCVIIYSKDGGVAEGAYLSSKRHFEQWRWNSIQKDVTHWKPLCEPPCL